MSRRDLLVALLPLTLLVAPVAASADRPVTTVYVREYASGDCIADDAAAIQTAIGQWHMLQASGQGGVLDFGTGCYRTTTTLHFGRGDGAFVYGTIRGDGPTLARIVVDPDVAVAADMNRLKYSSVSGLGFYGRGSGTGLLISSPEPGMGSSSDGLNHLLLREFGTCLLIGEGGGQAAAALTFTQLEIQNCTTGIHATAFNTLDLTFINLALVANQTGFVADSAHQINFLGGSGSGNHDTFKLLPAGHFSIRGWREEPPTGIWLQAGCCQAATFISVSDSMIYGTGSPDPPLIRPSGDVYLTVSNSLIGGRIAPKPSVGSTIITNSGIFDIAPWVANTDDPNGSGMFYRVEGNYRASNQGGALDLGPWPDATGRAVNGQMQQSVEPAVQP